MRGRGGRRCLDATCSGDSRRTSAYGGPGIAQATGRGAMETNVRTTLDIFNLPQHLMIPLFQRPYVWSETDQWLPIWQDVRRLAELRLTDPYITATHFLGAVVVQAQDNQTGNLPARNVI